MQTKVSLQEIEEQLKQTNNQTTVYASQHTNCVKIVLKMFYYFGKNGFNNCTYKTVKVIFKQIRNLLATSNYNLHIKSYNTAAKNQNTVMVNQCTYLAWHYMT